MNKPAVALETLKRSAISAEEVLNALGTAIVVVDSHGAIAQVNGAAEQFFKSSASHLKEQPLSSLLPDDSPLFPLIEQVRAEGTPVTEYGVPLATPRIGRHFVNIQATPLAEHPGWVVIGLQERSIADKMDRQLTHRGAARSVTAMAAMLAHEVKNPLSGIRGAAQLLEQGASAEDMPLTQLIRDEVDRICALVDRMEVFSDSGPLERHAVNIHQVLDRVRRLAQNGFGRHVVFQEAYDPSLPPVLGNRDQLVQVFLNLLKNAAEAVPETGGRIVLTSRYSHGISFAVPGSDVRVQLPLTVTIQDNGDGIPEDIQGDVFNPFVTSKPRGNGLGLALVAKIIGDHRGIVEFDSGPRGTTFRVMLPMAGKDLEAEASGTEAGGGGFA
jgi:two-component system nitrogen regulation sensor histidine kinase GlnL